MVGSVQGAVDNSSPKGSFCLGHWGTSAWTGGYQYGKAMAYWGVREMNLAGASPGGAVEADSTGSGARAAADPVHFRPLTEVTLLLL